MPYADIDSIDNIPSLPSLQGVKGLGRGSAYLPAVVPVEYAFQKVDLHSGDKTAYALPSQPEVFSVQAEYPYTVTHNIEGNPIHRTGRTLRQSITISGRTGYSESITYQGDQAEILKPHELIKKYKTETLNDLFKYTGVNYYTFETGVTLQDFKMGVEYQNVRLDSFTVEQAVDSTRLGYVWSLQLTAFGDTLSTDQSSVWGDFIGVATAALDTATLEIAALNALISGASNYALAPIRDTLGSVTRVSSELESLGRAVPENIAKIRETISQARAAISDVAHAFSSVMVSLESVADDEVFTSKYWNDYLLDWGDLGEVRKSFRSLANLGGDTPSTIEVVQQLETTQAALAAAQGYFGSVAATSNHYSLEGGSFLDKGKEAQALLSRSRGVASSNSQQESTSFISYTLRGDENMYTVAVELFNDISVWEQLVADNQWRDAYTDFEGRTVTAGMVILVRSGASDVPLFAAPRLGRGQDSLLTDLRLTRDGDLGVDRSARDLSVVSGEANFEQALINRLRTERGEIYLDPTYGIDSMIGTKIKPDQAALNIANQLQSDERVVTVRDIQIVPRSDTYDINVLVSPINGDDVNIVLPTN